MMNGQKTMVMEILMGIMTGTGKKYFALLFSIIYWGISCLTSYSQNITDSAITTAKDIVISVEHDKVYDEIRYVAKIKDFCSSCDDDEYSEERYGSHKHYEELRDQAWKEATRNIDSSKMGTFIYSFLKDKHKIELGNQGWGYIVFSLSRTRGLLKYSLTIRASDGIKAGQVFTKNECYDIFQALDSSVFNSWSEDIDNLEGAIKFRMLNMD